MLLLYYISKFFKKCSIPAILDSKIANSAKINAGANIVRTTIGKYSYIGNSTSIVNTQIGNFCSIAGGCIIGGASHPIDWVSTSPVFLSGRNCMLKHFSSHQFNPYENTTIGNDVWIGSNCLIKSGVSISDGVIIGMGSVVTKNIGPYEIWAGNPAKLIRLRFDSETILSLMQIKWWNWSESKISNSAHLFTNVKQFVKENI
ncbi:CatB-related O-acetyltransferase [uncultured Sphaerochaeta sp.]|uniref:CatB-related O-acetyltransferase n=1 Tax=uncultured Sphaerochaeta sp. TaxID=886478 RepID=UPI002A0A5B3E|nr:CatB-related O-acetyltransferase [uncultured Sphaerochaeta sp.]